MKLDSALGGKNHRTQTKYPIGNDLELLSELDAENAKQVCRVMVEQKGVVALDAVSNPAAAGHKRDSIT